MRFILRIFGWLFAAGAIAFVIGAAVLGGLIWHYSQDLPDYAQLRNYEPPVMTRVHAGDGSLIAEYARERRLYIPIQAVPKLIVDAYISAEDKNFYKHIGVDPEGLVRAAISNFRNKGTNRRQQGASTITQQVAKNFFLSPEQSYERKIREALVALKLESTYSKDKILELYLDVRGATVYTRSERATDAEAAKLAAKENQADAVAGLETSDELQDVAGILIDLARRETRTFSGVFARNLVDKLGASVRMHKIPLRSARFWVLSAPDVPSVLIELGYMSSPKDAELLTSSEWRGKAVGAVGAAVDEYFARERASVGQAAENRHAP